MSPVDETPDLLDDLIRSGAPSHIVKRVAMLIAAEEATNERRAKDAARKAEKRSENKASPQTSADVRGHVGQARTTPAPLDGPLPPPLASPPPTPLNPPAPKSTARDELSIVLDDERAQAVIDHRQRIRKPLTAHAAKLLAGKLGRCPDPNAAADTMIANGWQGFEPDWLENRAGRGPPPKQRGPSFLDIANATEAILRNQDEPPRPPYLRLAQ